METTRKILVQASRSSCSMCRGKICDRTARPILVGFHDRCVVMVQYFRVTISQIKSLHTSPAHIYHEDCNSFPENYMQLMPISHSGVLVCRSCVSIAASAPFSCWYSAAALPRWSAASIFLVNLPTSGRPARSGPVVIPRPAFSLRWFLAL